MLLRDPVHGLVTFEGRAGGIVGRLLDTREVQRLRRVRQLGLASYVYPGAEHSRFAHAVGAAHVMTRLLARLEQRMDDLPAHARLDAEAQDEAVAAALLHDLGHGPFSHLFEEVLPGARTHEEWTHDVISDSSTEVHSALESVSCGMAGRVADMLAGRHRLSYLPRLVSGVFDVDRADYLLRDSHATGVRYGLYDLDWLLQSFRFAELEGDWVVAIEGRKGLPPVESFFLARYAMYQQVYHHKATRAAEMLVRALFLRLGELVRAGEAPSDVPAAIVRAARSEQPTVGEYFALDDSELFSSVDSWERSKDATLARLASALRARRLPKTIPLPEDEPELWQRAEERARHIAEERGLRPELSVWLDVAEDVAYEEPEDASPEGLWVWRRHRPLARLGQVSFLLAQLRNKRLVRPRLIFDRALADWIRPAMDEVMS